jgi:hypothetical protein
MWNRRADAEEAGWISMVDLLLLLFAIVTLIAVHSLSDLQQTRLSQADGEMTIGELKEATFALEARLGEMIVAADEAQAGLDSYRLSLGDPGGDGSAVRERLEELRREIAERDVARARLEEALEEAEEALAIAQAQAMNAEASQVAAAAANDAEQRRLREALAGGASKLRDAQEEISRLLTRVARLDDLVADVRKDRQQAVADAVNEVQGKLDGLRVVMDRDKSLRQELLGIPGNLRNVVFVVDCSSSMNEGGRWEDAKRTVAAWITHLPVERAVLILFSGGPVFVPSELSSEKLFPQNSRELVIVDDAMRGRMAAELGAIRPHAGTSAYAALRRALEFKDLDAIVLFTDGAPDSPAEVKRFIEGWRSSEEGRRTRLHTVGVGDYFNRESGGFLRELARIGDGAFIGR